MMFVPFEVGCFRRSCLITRLVSDLFAKPAADAFEKKYGVKVEFARNDPGAIVLRELDLDAV